MTVQELNDLIARGEDSSLQFKEDVNNSTSLAGEIVAFSNASGGRILIGVADDGSVPGLELQDVRRINQLISNTASQNVRSPVTVQTENIPLGQGKTVIVLSIPDGIDKPYFDNTGVIWIKSGSDKRRINSAEELRRLFQSVEQVHADKVPTSVGVASLDAGLFRSFMVKQYNQDIPDNESELLALLTNMNLARDGHINLACLLLFGKNPQFQKPEFIVKAIAYPGPEIHSTSYEDSEDFEGTLQDLYKGAQAFIKRNLRKEQRLGVNSPGEAEIPHAVFEEIIVNALLHRDYFIVAPIKIFIFSNRIEIHSPGHLPNDLTVERIRAGNSVMRNPILASFGSKNLLPYRGLGTGVSRAVSEWPYIDFEDDREANLFKVTVHRKQQTELPATASKKSDKDADGPVKDEIKVHKGLGDAPKKPDKGAIKPEKDEIKAHNEKCGAPLSALQQEIIVLIQGNPKITYDELTQVLRKDRSTIGRNIRKLQKAGCLERKGSKKTGYWKVSTEKQAV